MIYKILLGVLLYTTVLPVKARRAEFEVPRTAVEAPDFDQPKVDGVERFLAFKNPVERGETIRFSVETKVEITYEVYNLVGKLVHRSTPEVKDGKQNVEIPTDELQSGIYFLKAAGPKTSAVKRFVLS